MRQSFEKGQTVYVNRWGSRWQKSIVADPEVVKKSYGYDSKPRDVYYVGINYVKDDGTADVDHQWDIINNRQRIVTVDRHAEIDQAKGIHRLHGDIQTHRSFEANFAEYVKLATTIVDTFKSPNDVLPLATFLKAYLSTRYKYAEHTPEQVTERRSELQGKAHAACTRLLELGQEVPELPS